MGEDDCDCTGEPAVEVIRKTQKNPPVSREGVSTSAVLRRTGERGGRKKAKD